MQQRRGGEATVSMSNGRLLDPHVSAASAPTPAPAPFPLPTGAGQTSYAAALLCRVGLLVRRPHRRPPPGVGALLCCTRSRFSPDQKVYLLYL